MASKASWNRGFLNTVPGFSVVLKLRGTAQTAEGREIHDKVGQVIVSGSLS